MSNAQRGQGHVYIHQNYLKCYLKPPTIFSNKCGLNNLLEYRIFRNCCNKNMNSTHSIIIFKNEQMMCIICKKLLLVFNLLLSTIFCHLMINENNWSIWGNKCNINQWNHDDALENCEKCPLS